MVQLKTEGLEGVRTWEAAGFADEAGFMCATGYRPSHPERFAGYGDLLVMTLKRGSIRAFHYHKRGIDTAVVLAGAIRVALYDMREDSATRGKIQEVLLEAKPSAVTFLQIPTMVAHGFQGLKDGSVLVDIPSTEEVATSDFVVADRGSVPYDFPEVGDA